MVSPDGKWLAYKLDSPGRSEIMVRPFPDVESAGPWKIGDGQSPLWSADGGESFYLVDNQTLVSQRMSGEPPFVLAIRSPSSRARISRTFSTPDPTITTRRTTAS